MAKVTGIVYVKVDGELMRSEKGASLDVGGMKRTPIMAAGVLVGYQEEAVPSEVEFKVAHTSSTKIRDMSDWVDKTLKFETDTGVHFLITNAFTADPVKLADGWATVKMQGDPAEQE